MDFPRFVSLITKRSLWLSNLDILAKLDPYEGALPKKHYEHRKWSSANDIPSEELDRIRQSNPNARETLDDKIKRAKDIRDLRIKQTRAYRKQYYVNCWHASSDESPAMWSIYSANGVGIAITSTTGRMIHALKHRPEQLYLGWVNYLDFDSQTIDVMNAFNAVLAKRNNFRHEREVRLVFCDPDFAEALVRIPNVWPQFEATLTGNIEAIENMTVPAGIELPCSLKTLIDGVWIAPTAPEWIFDTVESLCRLVGLEQKLIRSTLLVQPER